MIFLFVAMLIRLDSAESDLMLTVLPVGKNVMLEEHADLNLTCKVNSHGKPSERLNLTWKLPTRSNANGDRVSVYETNNQLTVTIHDLQDDDTGSYVCELQNKGIKRTRKIQVFIKSKKCVNHFFDCDNGICISKHYVCDGYVDCPNGYDESFKHCGPDACHDKILCEGRCIPKELCCDPSVDVNCTVNYILPCCYGILNSVKLSAPRCPTSIDCRYGHVIGNGNAVIYVLASCAIVVLVFSTMVMFLACRICSRRAEERWSRVLENEVHHQCPAASLNHRDIEAIESNDLLYDFQDENPYEDHPDENFALVHFVEGIGFQLTESRPKPPPYTENSIGVPPPPYESTADISNVEKDSSTDV
ncbi:low-density lipoprotein receptor class A domain-containing protein 3-like [Uloborus diversus]|uniref:low-density lipoprotein receptor class A domain-containing protein 3-like n=1 Tax=Uloborus diversus TaxID=327109 RepID=UPI002409CD64|nr:low-density lipoprotein receptor class A domain-containing protein 3-like [Uloborus diversus]